MHPYPAKLLLNIPYAFLNCDALVQPGSKILDPFCGSGTVLLESMVKGFDADGCDANPLARIISTAKTRRIDPTLLAAELERIVQMSRECRPHEPEVVNIDYWFYPRVRHALGRLAAAIHTCCSVEALPFFQTCFSACVRRVSLADPRLSVPVRLNADRADVYGAKGSEALRRLRLLKRVDVARLFWRLTSSNIRRMKTLWDVPSIASEPNLFTDARRLPRPDGSYDLVLTSPPYAGAQKYIRASCLSLGWLGLTPGKALRPLEQLSIGREHLTLSERGRGLATGIPEADRLLASVEERNPLRAQIAATYLREMMCALREAARVTKVGGHLVLVAGENLVAEHRFDTPRYLQQLAEAHGCRTRAILIDEIRTRGLMVKRNRTAGLIPHEAIIVMERLAP
jgi:hypothetical protein